MAGAGSGWCESELLSDIGEPTASGTFPEPAGGDASEGGESEDVLPDVRFLDFLTDGDKAS